LKVRYFLGIDIGKKTFHATLTMDGQIFYDQQVDNTPPSIKKYFGELKSKFSLSYDQLIVCMEHTGIYCYPVLDYLTKCRVKVCIEPALRIKQSQGMQRGKTDRIDSQRIAKYLFKNVDDLRIWQPKREVVQKLRALLVVRERLTRAKNQFEIPIREAREFIEASVRNLATRNCKAAIAGIKKDLRRIDIEISSLVKSDSQLEHQMKIATSVTGIGPIIAANMIITTNEFTDITTHKKYACYAGVAPFQHSSGTSVRGKTKVSHLANKKIKSLLHLGARSAVLSSPELKEYYSRKLSEGKAPLSVLNAVCNKLISRVFVCIKNQRLYEKHYSPTLVRTIEI
jgi:transposase